MDSIFHQPFGLIGSKQWLFHDHCYTSCGSASHQRCLFCPAGRKSNTESVRHWQQQTKANWKRWDAQQTYSLVASSKWHVPSQHCPPQKPVLAVGSAVDKRSY